MIHNRQVEQKLGGRGRGREWATLGVHPLSWLLSNNRLEKVPFVSVRHTSSNRLLLSNQDKGCTPSVAHSLALPLGPDLLNLWTIKYVCVAVRLNNKKIYVSIAAASICFSVWVWLQKKSFSARSQYWATKVGHEGQKLKQECVT